VTRRLLVLPLLAALLLLPGCFWWVAPMAVSGRGDMTSETHYCIDSAADGVTEDECDVPENSAMAKAKVRAAIPAIEAYYADNLTYKGATLRLLRERYDAGLQGIRIVKASDRTYCIQSAPGDFPWHKAGPAADILPGPCP
jgi:hypothetical protein